MRVGGGGAAVGQEDVIRHRCWRCICMGSMGK
jgi:hypothetical protein